MKVFPKLIYHFPLLSTNSQNGIQKNLFITTAVTTQTDLTDEQVNAHRSIASRNK